ncbi:Lrp/AsnC family transcriptional regulator [Desulfitobacterium sp. Sab5]|uniref:siroheme decarboxylase subunit beta n=1 Tax=Desulfitobacterium nosdiversum TaxID=3375356 RepID=UPI003CF80B12
MDTVERELLNTIQTNFPIMPRPFQSLGERAGVSEEEAWERVTKLRQEGIIRRLGGVFDSHRLGYHSTLCAAKVPQEKISDVAELLMETPGVTHNYLREHDYNMWFTLIAPSKEEVEQILNKVRSVLGSDQVYSLPAVRLFKISVDFNFKNKTEKSKPELRNIGLQKTPGAWRRGEQAVVLSEQEKALVRVLQVDLPYSLTPFAEIAQMLQWTENEVLELTRSLLERGLIRRFGAVLRHQKAGFTANAMGVWPVPEDQAHEIGKKMSAFREVSHCYQRPTLPDWPYTLFTMIHGQSVEDCQNVMERISEETGIKEYRMLFSKAELKKSSMQYFMEEND